MTSPNIAGRFSVMQVVDGLQAGGKERVAVSLANGLAKKDCVSHLIASRDEGPLLNAIGKDVRYWCARRSSRFDRAGLKRIARYVDDNGIDVVHTHNHFSAYMMRVVFWMSKRKPVHVAHDHHGPAIGNRMMGFYDWLMLRNVDAYVAVSEELRDRARRLLKLPDDRCIYLRNGVEVFPPRQPWSGRPTVVQVANLQAPKGHVNSVRAAAVARQSVPDLRWVCIGRIDESLDYVVAVRRLIKELKLDGCVDLAGASDDARSHIRQANIGLVASDSEGLPLAMLEYMAEQVPVVTTDVGQCRSLAADSGAGIVVPAKDPQRLAEAVVSLLKDSGRARQMGVRGRACVRERYSADVMVDKVCELYEFCLGRKRGQ